MKVVAESCRKSCRILGNGKVMLEKTMQEKLGLEKVCDNRSKKRQLCDNFATTRKRKNSNEIIRNIYIYIEVVATFLLVSTHMLNPPPLGVDPIGSANTLSLPLYRDNFLRQLFATTANRVDGKASFKELTK